MPHSRLFFAALVATIAPTLAASPSSVAGATRAVQPTDAAWTLASPSGAISMTVELVAGSLRYSLSRADTLVMQDSHLGMRRTDTAFISGLTLVSTSTPCMIDENYSMPHGKASQLRNHAVEQTLEFSNPLGKRIQLIFRVYDDGAAFRYRFPESSTITHTVTDELTTFRIAADGRAVIQPDMPESLHDIVETQNPPAGIGGWALPALFDLGHSWVMIAESDLDRSYCATQLDVGAEDREYRIKLPDDNYGTRTPSWTLPWEMPWRVVIIGRDVGTVIGSNLVTHLADPSHIADLGWIKPGRVSWHWWALAWVGSMLVLKDYVNLAESMGWEYSLVDADWDDFHSDSAMQDLVDYAADRGVGIFLWYNAAGPQNSYDFSPRDRMWDPAVRRAEMAKLASWGVKGIKVDFFDSDKQVMIQHYLDILEDAATYGLLVLFHGSATPRGWSRAWPNMMSTEAVRGAEYYLIDPNFPGHAPLHNVEVAFTRNVVGPMDYTPVTFTDGFYPHITTNAHELALSVVFESGLVHMADRSDSYEVQPQVVRDFLREVPAAWDEIRFLEGDPSSHIVLARRKGARWYIAGLNGTEAPRSVSIDLTQFDYSGGGTRISDGSTPRSFSSGSINGTQLDLTMSARGGFVAVVPGVLVDAPSPPIGPLAVEAARRLDPSLASVQPNPFIAETRITYTLPTGGPARLALYDPTGRRVRTLVNESRPPGTHVVRWDGTDDAGARVAAGVYFGRLTAGGKSAVGHLLRLY